MNINYYIIVGDDYKKFSDQANVYTVSEFYKTMLESSAWPEPNACVIIGQGIGYHDREFIDMALKKRDIDNFHPLPSIASVKDTHKRAEENILITQPRKLARLNYGFDLTITDKVDRLSDHVTGQHVGAMLLVEAARQATIAVLEHEYCTKIEDKFSLILDRFDCKFDAYLFPLPASINTVIHEIKVSPKNICVIVTSTVKQCNSEIATISLDVTLCSSQLMEKIEARKSQSAVKDLCRSFTESPLQELNIA
jgi:hypothetical protein